MATNTSSSAWVSSLTKSIEADAAARTAALPQSSAGIIGKSSANAIFSTTVGAKEDKNSMMAAFTDLGLDLDKASHTVAAASSKALLARKVMERQEEERALEEHRARREALQIAKEAATVAPPSALMQAIDAFAGEVSQSDTFSSSLKRSDVTGSSTMSRRTRQKMEKAHERADAYESRRGVKSSRDAKRHQRREKYRHVY